MILVIWKAKRFKTYMFIETTFLSIPKTSRRVEGLLLTPCIINYVRYYSKFHGDVEKYHFPVGGVNY